MSKRVLFAIVAAGAVAFGQVQWIETSHADFADGTELDPSMYVSRRANLDSDSGCIEFFARFDVNNDGEFDLCCADGATSNNFVRLYFGADPARCSLFSVPNGGNCDLADLNMDGYAELVHSLSRQIFWGTPNGPSRTMVTTLPYGNEATFVYDLDKDGYLDVVITGSRSLYIYWGSAAGYSGSNMTEVSGLPSGPAHNIEIADLDRDGWGDIILPLTDNYAGDPCDSLRDGGRDWVMYWGPGRQPREQHRLPFPDNGHGLSVADLNKDGWLDVVLTNRDGSLSYIYWGATGGIDTTKKTIVHPGKTYGGSSCVDLNKDGWLDIVCFRGGPMTGAAYKPLVYHNMGSAPYFADTDTHQLGSLTVDATGGFVADINGDQNTDIFLNCCGDSSYVLWGPDFTTHRALPVNRDHHGVFREVGNVYDRSYSGQYTSNVFDAGQAVTSGFVSWVANTPGGSQVKVKVRGGTIAGQDTAWTNWQYCSSQGALPQQVLNNRLYQYQVEFLYTTPCFLPWLERIEFGFNGMAPQTRVIRVKNAGNPVGRCQVLVNGIPQIRLTDSRGELRIDNLRIGDQVWAQKKVHTEPAWKLGHGAVGNTMYELWMDTKELYRKPGTENEYEWYPHLIVSTSGDIDLDLAHSLFKWNLVMSLDWLVSGEEEWQRVAQKCSTASSWLYEFTDGQMVFGTIAAYDDHGHWTWADVHVSGDFGETQTVGTPVYDEVWNGWDLAGIYSPAAWFGRIEFEASRWANTDFNGTGKSLVHEFCHYALGFGDEYRDGNYTGKENWDYRNWFHPEEFPGNYGLMDEETRSNVTEMSTWCMYLESYPQHPDPQTVTDQYYVWRKPCWEALKRVFEGEYAGIEVRLTRADVRTPRRSHWDPAQARPVEDTRRKGQITPLRCVVLRNPATSDGIAGGRRPSIGGMSAATPSWRERRLTGPGDCGHDYSMRACEAPVDSHAPRIVVGLYGDGDTLHTLQILVWTDESLPEPPHVVVNPMHCDSIDVGMTRLPGRCYRGSAFLADAYRGQVRLSVRDTLGNIGEAVCPFALQPVPVGNRNILICPDGQCDLFLPESCLAQRINPALSVVSAPPVLPGDSLVQVGPVYCLNGTESLLVWRDSGTLNVAYMDSAGSRFDKRTVRLMRWETASAQWVGVPARVSLAGNSVSARVTALGIYALFASVSSDATSPSRIHNLQGQLRDGTRTVELCWTAPGDDSTTGQATSYDTRFSTDSITDTTWDSCETVQWEPVPSAAGDTDSMVVSLPEPGVRYYFALKASDEAGNVSALSNVTSVVAAAPPPIPVGSTPANRAYINDTTPTFWWGATLTDTGFYRLQYARDPEFTQGLVTLDSLDTVAVTVPDSQALDEGEWFWRVAAYDKHGNTYGYQEPPYQFTVDTTPPAAPVLRWPADGQYVGSRRPRLIWTASGGDWGRYEVQLSRDSLFADSMGTFSNVYDTMYRLVTPLPESATLVYWRVKATDGADNVGEFSQRSMFYVDTMLPSAPYPVLPYDGDMVYDSLPSFVWTSTAANAVLKSGSVNYADDNRPNLAGPVTYRLQVALNDSFSPCVVDTLSIADTSLTLPAHLQLEDNTYFWRVEAVDSAGRHSGFAPAWWLIVEARADIAGSVSYYSNSRPVPAVKLAVEGRSDTTETGLAGDYTVTNLPMFQDYLVTPLKRETARQGAVGAYDAFMALAHSVHQDALDSLQFIAADVTGDTTVSAFDAQRILEYAVARRRHFPVGARPGGDTVDWAFQPPTRTYDSIWENQTEQDYLGILYGDPTGNWPGGDMLDGYGGGSEAGGAVTYFELNMPGLPDEGRGQKLDARAQNPGVDVTLSELGESKGLSGEIPRFASLTRNDSESRPAEVSGPTAGVVFSLVARGARDVVSADALVRYDAGRYTLRGIRTTEQTEGHMVAAADRDGLVRVSMAGTRKLNGDVALLELVFEERNPTAKSAKALVTLSESDESKGLSGEISRLPLVARNDSADGRSLGAAVGRKPSAASPVAEVVWLVLNEGQAQQQPPVEDGATGDKQGLPATFYLSPPRPNPFGQGTCINYGLPRASGVNLSVFDAAGRRVRLLVAGTQPAGRYSQVWNGTDAKGRQLAGGIYFIRLATDDLRFQRKVTLIRQ